MASSTLFIPFLFLATLFLSLQTHARESHFFSKVTPLHRDSHEKDAAEVSNKEAAVVAVNKHEQEPTFIPESQNGYGLYGHDSGQLPPSSTTPTNNGVSYTTSNTYLPYKAESDQQETNLYDSHTNNNNNYYNKDAYVVDQNSYYTSKDSYDANRNGLNNNYYFNKDAYDANSNDLSNTKLSETNYRGMSNRNTNPYYHNNGASKFNVERQGMSDTRFLEGGKYYYDLSAEKYNPTMYGNSREVDTRFSNNNGYYENNQNMYENNNSAYQNEEEFKDDQDEFFQP